MISRIEEKTLPRVRVSAVLIQKGEILLVEQDVTQKRRWAHPGGKVENGETLEEAVIREMKEETGLDVEVHGLLFVTEMINAQGHWVILAFEVKQKGGILGTGQGRDVSGGKIKSVKMVAINDLASLGFSQDYQDLVKSGFPDRGRYIKNILA